MKTFLVEKFVDQNFNKNKLTFCCCKRVIFRAKKIVYIYIHIVLYVLLSICSVVPPYLFYQNINLYNTIYTYTIYHILTHK